MDTYKYKKIIRKTDERVMDLFRNLVTIKEDGKATIVPIMWCTYEALRTTVAYDAKTNGTRMPVMNLINVRINPSIDSYDDPRSPNLRPAFTIKYELNSLTALIEDGYQIIEQTLGKMCEPLYLDQDDGYQTRVWLTGVDLMIKQDTTNVKFDQGMIRLGETQGGEVLQALRNRFILFAEYNSRKKPEVYDGEVPF